MYQVSRRAAATSALKWSIKIRLSIYTITEQHLHSSDNLNQLICVVHSIHEPMRIKTQLLIYFSIMRQVRDRFSLNAVFQTS